MRSWRRSPCGFHFPVGRTGLQPVRAQSGALVAAYRVCGPDAGASAALGSGAGLSDLVLRYVMTSARSLPRGKPAKVIDVPGMNPRGLVRKWSRSSTVHLPPLAFMAAE